jgi:enoyl-CoA hydratase
MAAVSVENRDGIGLLTLNDPERRNAITLAMAAEIETGIAALAADPQVFAVVVSGAGAAFCAGADRELLAAADEDALRRVYAAFLAVRSCPLPTVAAVNGPAVGAGLNLALACDVRIAAQSARFDARFLQLPVHPGGGHLWMLERLVGSQAAAAMVVFDQPVSGPDAVPLGLAWSCVPDGEVVSSALAFCARLTGSPTPALATQIKATLRASSEIAAHEDAVELELRAQLDSMRIPSFRKRMAAP